MIFRILEFAVCLVLEWYNILSPFDKILALILIEYLKICLEKRMAGNMGRNTRYHH